MTLYAGLLPTPDPDEWQPTLADVPHDPPGPPRTPCPVYRARDGRRTYCRRPAHTDGPHVSDITSYPEAAWQPGGVWCPTEEPFA